MTRQHDGGMEAHAVGGSDACFAMQNRIDAHDDTAGGSRCGRQEQAAARRCVGCASASMRGLWVLALASLCTAVAGQQDVKARPSPHMKPLLGGHLYWQIDKDFMQDGNNRRRVQFTLLTSFEADDDACTYNRDNAVLCQGTDSKTKPPNGVADVHGVLCVKMIRHSDSHDDPEIATAHIENPDDDSLGPCPYTWKTLRGHLTQAERDKCEQTDLIENFNTGLQCYSNIHPALTSVGGKAFRPAAGANEEIPAVIGAENDFVVLSIHEADTAEVFNRKINRRKIVFGAKQHTVIVPEDVSGIVAYLAAPNGTVIGEDQGMLLQPCELNGNNLLAKSETPVMCSHNTMDLRTNGGIKTPGFHSASDLYWNGFLNDAQVPVADMAETLAGSNTDSPWRVGKMGAGERDTYNGLPRAQSNERKGMSELVWPLHKQAPALETYVPLCASHSLATRSCASYPLGNYFSPISGLPLAVEIPVTPRTIKHPHIYGHRPGEEDCSSTSSPPCFYSSQGPLIFKAYDMDGQKLSLYHPGMSSETLFNRTARCWNGDVDEVGLWDPQQVGTSPRYECFGGPRNGQACEGESQCAGTGSEEVSCRPAWPIRMCTHAKTCTNGDGAVENPAPKRCNVDADCGGTGQCLLPPHGLGKPLPSPYLGMNCSSDQECSTADEFGVKIFGSCQAPWSLCREMFDMDRSSIKDTNRAGFLLKLDYDWIHIGDLGVRDEALFATTGRTVLPETSPDEGKPHSVFMQHVVGIADLPFKDVDNPLDRSEGIGLRDRVADHISPYPTLVDQQRVSVARQNKLATASTASTMTQHIFSTFSCYSGTENAPPEFFTSKSPSTATRLIKTDIECQRVGACTVDLHIIDYVMKTDGLQDGFKISSDRVAIEMSLGTAPITEGQLFNLDPSGTSQCEGTGALSCRFQLQNDLWDGPSGTFKPEAVGRIVVKCFVAVDKHDPESCAPTGGALVGRACTCRSMPLCVKFKIVGSPPQFIAPTPLVENSLDDRGILVPGRTDVAACEGYDMVLPLVAKDADGDSVRIFVHDVDVSHSLYNAKVDWYRTSGGLYNSDFFESMEVYTPEHCGVFQGYGARRIGDNSEQLDLSPSQNETEIPSPGSGGNVGANARRYVVKSVNGGYRGEIVYVQQPSLEIRYSPTREAGNGIDVFSSQNKSCVRRPGGVTSTLACREKLANMDQVICAYAYDNSRYKVGRWVGQPDPNGDDLQVWQRDHSNGDQASKQHCWRIVMQSPPSFVTDVDGEESPFSKEWIESTSIYTPTSGEGNPRFVEAAFKRVPMAVTQYRRLRFVAQDPQAKDGVQIVLLEEPGIVNNLKLGRSQCIEREVVDGDPAASRPMCRAEDLIDPVLYPNEPWTAPMNTQSRSPCSRAERILEYTALASEAGKEYRVCMVARDDSALCSGIAPSASERGWYGETHCIIFDVLKPVLQWSPDTLALFAGEVDLIVGCTSSLTLAAHDTSMSAVTRNHTGNYHVLIHPLASSVLPEGASLSAQSAASSGCIERTGSCSASREMTWRYVISPARVCLRLCLWRR